MSTIVSTTSTPQPASNKAARTVCDDASHILVIDDDNRIRELLNTYLRDNGFRVTTAKNAAVARQKMTGLTFDLLVLDVMMPGESGFDLTKSLRKTSDIPILMLTARAETDARIEGLEHGVDDYLSKPFDPRELLLRISSILKRRKKEFVTESEVRLGDCVFHVERGELKRDGETIRLTTRERDMLRVFASHPGQTVSRMELAQSNQTGGARAVDVQINRLRQKLENRKHRFTCKPFAVPVTYCIRIKSWLLSTTDRAKKNKRFFGVLTGSWNAICPKGFIPAR